MSRRGPTRRELLGAGAAGAAGLLALPATAIGATSTTGEAPFSATDRLQRLIRLELLLLYCYRHVLASSILGPRAQRTLAPFEGHEQAHVDALETQLKARGEPSRPDPTASRPPIAISRTAASGAGWGSSRVRATRCICCSRSSR